MQTDRNLLFGVLAFQDEYIDGHVLMKTLVPETQLNRHDVGESFHDSHSNASPTSLPRSTSKRQSTLFARAESQSWND